MAFSRCIRQLSWRLVLVTGLVTWGAWALIGNGPLRWLENWASDLRWVVMSVREPASDQVVVLTITEETLNAFPYRSPISRAYIADLLRLLETKGAKAVGLDILFDRPSEDAADRLLLDTFRQLRIPVVVGHAAPSHLTAEQHHFLGNYTAGLRRGYVDLPIDNADGIVRHVFPGRNDGDGQFVPGLAFALAGLEKPEVLQMRKALPIHYRGLPPDVPMNAVTTSVVHYPSHVLPALPDDWFRGKFVLVGADFPQSSEDRWRTPYVSLLGFQDGQLPGVMIHALILAQLLEERGVRMLHSWWDPLVYLAVVVVIAGIVRPRRPPFMSVLWMVVFLLAYWAVAFVVFRYTGIAYALVGPSSAGIVMALWRLQSHVQLYRRRHQEAQARALKNKEIAVKVLQNYGKKLESEVTKRTAELVATQQKLIASEKMAALGVFTAGIAHEINNPANFVAVGAQNTVAHVAELKRFVTELLSDEPEPEIVSAFDHRFSNIEKANVTVLEGIKRIEHVVKQLRANHPEGNVGRQAVEIVSVLENTWQMLLPTLKVPVRMHSDFQVRPRVLCSVADIQQVFIALLSNAVHAIEDAVSERSPDYQGEIRLGACIEGQRLVLTFTDNGIGIRAEIVSKIFDPFFTTKAVGRGAGLGLSMARDVILQHGGTLEVASGLDETTTLVLRLPCQAESMATENRLD